MTLIWHGTGLINHFVDTSSHGTKNQTNHFDSAFDYLQIFDAKVVMNSRYTLRSNVASDGVDRKLKQVWFQVVWHTTWNISKSFAFFHIPIL